MTKIPTKEEISEIRNWLEANKNDLPQEIVENIFRLLDVIKDMSLSSAKAKKVLQRLREAMGILPKSERGRTDKMANAPASINVEELSPEEKVLYDELKAKRDELLKSAAGYARKLRKLKPRPKSPEQLSFPDEELGSCMDPVQAKRSEEFDDAHEMVFSSPSGDRKTEEQKQALDRMKEFGKEKGLSVTYDYTKRIDLKILVTDTTYQVETVTDPETGKSVRASMQDIGPEGSTMTWGTIANLVKLVVGFAIPINRLALLIGQSEFTSSKICRVLKSVATVLCPIYTHMAEDLAESEILSGDDTKTKVLEKNLPENNEDLLAKKLDDFFGWASPKADGTGDKKGLNVSLLMGRTNRKDPRSTIRFFRTHVGSVGNLLSKLLEMRLPKSGPLIFQGDLSTTNLPMIELRKKFQLTLAGCGSHARRPFWRHREEDGTLCYFMLRGFLALSHIEDLINAHGRTRENILRYRNRYGRKIWQAMRNRCIAAVTGDIPGRFTMANWMSRPNIWPPDHDLYRACMYVINHYDELTLYLSNPYLKYTNNGSERGLRIEKCFLSSSKFSKTRNGRAVLDILRTINATCTAARIDLTAFLRHVFKHRDQIELHPEKYTPYAVALHFEKEKQAQQKA